MEFFSFWAVVFQETLWRIPSDYLIQRFAKSGMLITEQLGLNKKSKVEAVLMDLGKW